MSKTILYLATLMLASSACAEAPHNAMNTTRDGGGYEATLRTAGIAQTGGMAWAVVRPAAASAPALAEKPGNLMRASVPEVAKSKAGA
jgi:hypothetical protein